MELTQFVSGKLTWKEFSKERIKELNKEAQFNNKELNTAKILNAVHKIHIFCPSHLTWEDENELIRVYIYSYNLAEHNNILMLAFIWHQLLYTS